MIEAISVLDEYEFHRLFVQRQRRPQLVPLLQVSGQGHTQESEDWVTQRPVDIFADFTHSGNCEKQTRGNENGRK